MLEFIDTIVDAAQVIRFQWRIHLINFLTGLVGSSRTIIDVIFSKQPSWWCEKGMEECSRRRSETKNFIPCDESSILDGVRLENGSENYFLVCFKLVCKDDHFDFNLPFASSTFFLGAFFGGCLFGMLSDWKGRRFTIILSLIGALVSSLVTVFSPVIQVYLVGRLLDGLFFGGYSINTFVLSVEYSRPDRRHCCALSYFIMWGPAMVLMLLLSDLLSSYTWHLQALLSSVLILVVLITVSCLGVESIAWMLSSTVRHNANDVRNLLQTIAKIIKVEVGSVPNDRFHRSQSTQSVQDVLRGHRYKKYRTSVLCLLYIWFITAIAYYLNYYEAFFKQSPKELRVGTSSLLLLSAGCNLTGFLSSVLLARCLSRRHSVFIITLLAASSSFGIIANNKYSDFVLLLVGKIVTSAQFGLVYIWTAELAPTPARGLVAGLCFGMSRLGATLAPHINYIADILSALPQVAVGTSMLTCFLAAWALPETKNIKLLNDHYQTKDFQRYFEKYRKPRNLSKSLESSI